jgi:hypothetical protein
MIMKKPRHGPKTDTGLLKTAALAAIQSATRLAEMVQKSHTQIQMTCKQLQPDADKAILSLQHYLQRFKKDTNTNVSKHLQASDPLA